MKRLRYTVCPYCGAHLDYGEKCDCRREAETQREETETGPFAGIPVQVVILTGWTEKTGKTA